MKINSNDEILKSAYYKAIKPAHKLGGKDFASFFRNALNVSDVKSEQLKTPDVCKVTKLNFNTTPEIRITPIVDQVENYLDILDEYQQKLGNPLIALREIHPLVSEMENERDNLIPILKDLSDDDELKDMLNQTLVTSSLEIIKFNRGDYI